MKSRKLTLTTLRKRGACKGYRDEFERRFGEYVDVTEELCAGVAAMFDWNWAAQRLLSQSAQAYYDRTHKIAWYYYERIRTPAWDNYERITSAAWYEYKRICAAAGDDWRICADDYERIRAAAWADYERASAPARAEHRRIRAATQADYERTIATAWAWAYIRDHGAQS